MVRDYKPRDKYCPKSKSKASGWELEVSIEPARTAGRSNDRDRRRH
jgi:hypothetical protein